MRSKKALHTHSNVAPGWRHVLRVFFFLALLFAGKFGLAQGITVNGTVNDSLGKGMAEVSILIKGTNRGTTTNQQGEFQLQNVSPSAVLVVSSIGMLTQEVAVSGRTSVVITFREDATSLQNVVVTGFQRLNKKSFTGSAVTLKAEDVKMEGVVDVSRMLEGRAAGVSVQNVSGTFGSAPKVRVRGATSISGENKPLWVVDGVVLEDIVNISNDQLSSGDPTTLLGSSVAGINANDIESFVILKDASAAAMYGARAMNGVVVITTKKGRSGKPVVSYTGNFSTQLKPSYSGFNIMNSGQQMSVLAELERKGMFPTDIASRADGGVYAKMYERIESYDSTTGRFGLENSTEARSNFLRRYAAANTDWFDLLFRNSLLQEHAISVSAGSDRSQTYVSTSFYSDNGWTIADKVNRYTLNFRNNYKFNDKISAGFLTVGSVRRQEAPGALGRVSNPVFGQFDREFDINPFSYALNSSRTLTAYDEQGDLEYFRRNYAPFNILNELDNNKLKLSVYDLKLQGDLTFQLTKNFRYEFVGAVRYVRSTREHEINEKSNMAGAYRAAGNQNIINNNPYLYRDLDVPEARPVVVLPYGGFYNRQEDLLLNYDFRNNIHFTKSISDKHDVNVLLGQQMKYTDRQNFNNTGFGYQYENGGVPNIDYRILKQAIERNFNYYGMSKEYDRFAAFYGSLNYTFDKRINLTANARYDGSNRLGRSTTARWLPTWSVAGSWNVETEPFMANLKAIDYLTLRASYGLTGSMGPATNSSIVLRSGVSGFRTYVSEREPIITLESLENADLTWEKQYTTNIGFDVGLFQRKLTLAFDAYKRKSFDLIDVVRTSGIGGEGYKVANYADLESKGLEFMLGGQIINQRDWGWKTNLTFGYNQNKITRAQSQPRIFDLVKAEGGNIVGFPVNSLFSIDFNKLDPFSGIPVFTDEKGDLSGDVNLQNDNTSFLKYNGSVDPRFTGGFSNTFNYKAISLNVFVTYQAGNKIRLYPAFRTSYSDLDAMPREFYDRWILPGDQNRTNVPPIVDALYARGLGGSYPYNNYNYSTERIADGGFVRLKTVALSYQVPAPLLKTLHMGSFSVTAAAQNPWLIYADPKLKGQDPEFFNTGGVAQPVQKQFTLSLKIGI
ncbi:MAG TPA: SusC/RagA family TonB-linked outer membrane protein [Flavisolibacter sp.]|nr:SusC/RagA family TonB-linked outer membrane protein [Flavisolibacter sp.]